eukprot:gene18331-24022_t
MGKEKKGLNPADAYRREQKKIQFKKNRVEKQKVKEIRELLNDPKKIQLEINKLQKESDENKLDKSLKDRIKELKEMEAIALRKVKSNDVIVDSESNSEINNSTTSIVQRSIDIPKPIVRRPDESIYYHPVFNPSGAPPPNQPQVYKPLVRPGSITNSTIPLGGQNGIPPPPPPRPNYLPNQSHQFNYPPIGSTLMYPPLTAVRPIGMPGLVVPPLPVPFQTIPTVNNPRVTVEQSNISSKARPVHRSSVVDPLDPSGKGYADKGPTALPKRNIKLEQLEQHAIVSVAPTIEPSNNSIIEDNNYIQESNQLSTNAEINDNEIANQSFTYPLLKESKGLSMLGDYGDSDEDNDNDDEYHNNNPNSSIIMPTIGSVISSVNRVQGPKIIRLDKSLTQFVPTSVKVKRDNVIVKKPSKPPTQTLSQDQTSISSNQKPMAVDEAYQRFLEEIESLGAL